MRSLAFKLLALVSSEQRFSCKHARKTEYGGGFCRFVCPQQIWEKEQSDMPCELYQLYIPLCQACGISSAASAMLVGRTSKMLLTSFCDRRSSSEHAAAAAQEIQQFAKNTLSEHLSSFRLASSCADCTCSPGRIFFLSLSLKELSWHATIGVPVVRQRAHLGSTEPCRALEAYRSLNPRP